MNFGLTTNITGYNPRMHKTTQISAEAPEITSSPSIAGTAQEGETLTATAGGVTGNPTPTRSWTWQRSADGSTGWTDISGETASTYELTADDVGKYVRAVQAETNAEGSDTAYSEASAQIAAASGAATQLSVATQPNAGHSGEVLDVQPVVHLLDQYGNLTDSTATVTATVDVGTLGGDVDVAAVSGVATFTDLTLTGTALVDITMSFASAGLTGADAETTQISAEAPEITSSPSIAGTAQEGETLTATAGSVTGNPTPTRSWKWQISDDGATGWVDIPGETASTYELTADDVGKYVRAVQAETNAEGSDTAYSDASEVSSTTSDTIKGATWDQDADSYTSIGVQTPVHDACKICLVTPGSEGAGDVVLNQYDYTRDAQGNSVDLEGSQGHTMLRIPKHYYGYDFSDPVHGWRNSLSPFEGSFVHPAFVKAGVEVPYRYIGVYEACGYDVSAGSYVDGDGANYWLDNTNDKLGSIVGKKPITYFTRSQGRTMAANVGTGWTMMDFWLYSLMKLLYITKYADLDSQGVLGAGNTRFAGWDFASRISATGKVLSIDAPGQSTEGGDIDDYCNLLGIENPFGDIYEFVDGWNIYSGVNYICSDPADFADDTTTNYAQFGSTNPTSNGYQDLMQPNVALLPASVGASDATKFCDYYSYASGWRVALVSGAAYDGSLAGISRLSTYYASSYTNTRFGARLCY